MAFPNTMTLAELRTAARQRADMVNSEFVSDAEFNSYINMSYYALYDLLIQKFGNDYFVADPYQFTADGTSSTVALPDDFYKALGLDVSISGASDSWVSVAPFMFAERNKYTQVGNRVLGNLNVQYRINGSNLMFVPVPQAGTLFQLWYIPRLEPLVDDTDVADGVSGWLEFVITDAAIKAMQKEESDVSILMRQKMELVARIEAAAENRDAGSPQTISDVYATGDDWTW